MEEEEIRACNHMIVILANLQSMHHDDMHHCLAGDTNACNNILKHIDRLKNDIDQLGNARCVSRPFAEGLKEKFEEDFNVAKIRGKI